MLRAEGVIAFGQQLWGGISLALGGGLVTAIITWLQGSLARYGFAGFVIVILAVSILLLTLEDRISKYKQRHKKIADGSINLEVAAHIFRTTKPLIDSDEGARRVVQLASEGKIEISAARVLGHNKNGWPDFGPLIKLDLATIKNLWPVENATADVSLNGKFSLTDGQTTFGRTKISVTQLVDSLFKV